MFNIDELRTRQEQRLVPAIEAWNEAKKRLEEAITAAETKEREFREISEDVRRRIEAIDLVVGMARELEGATAETPCLAAAETQLQLSEPPPQEMKAIEAAPPVPPAAAATESHSFGLLRKTSRPLFPVQQRSKYASLSILQ